MQVTLRWLCDGSEIKPGNDIENSRIAEILSTFSHHLQLTSNHLPSQRETWTGVTARGEFLTWLQIHLQRSWSVQVWRDCRRKSTIVWQYDRFRELPVDPSYFDDYILHPINYILQENYERKLYCLECEEIRFHDGRGEEIWKTKGSGFMDDLPKQVSI